VRVVLTVLLLPLVVATVVGLWLLWPSGSVQAPPGTVVGRAHATVLDVHGCRGDIPRCRAATVDLTAGAGAPGHAEALLPYGAQAPTFQPGDEILLSHTAQAPPGQRYQFLDFDRTEPLALLVGVFVVGVLLLSRWRGLGSLASLAFSLLLIAFFTLPTLLGGADPLLVAVVTASAIMIVTLYLSHGFNVRTGVAMLGTLLSLLVTGVLGAIFTGMGDFTGLKDETSGLIGAVAGQVDLSGLLLAGLVIGALFGVAVSQEPVAQEVVRGLVGGLGIIAAVPLTTGIAVLVAGPLTSAAPVSRGTTR
jgi:uncharacterized membrane protein